jgi:hypothetical protein
MPGKKRVVRPVGFEHATPGLGIGDETLILHDSQIDVFELIILGTRWHHARITLNSRSDFELF